MSYHLFSLVRREARKQHRCIWCGEAILPSEEYLEERSVYDRLMQHLRWHPECRSNAEAGWSDGDDSEFMPHSQDRPRKEPFHA